LRRKVSDASVRGVSHRHTGRSPCGSEYGTGRVVVPAPRPRKEAWDLMTTGAAGFVRETVNATREVHYWRHWKHHLSFSQGWQWVNPHPLWTPRLIPMITTRHRGYSYIWLWVGEFPQTHTRQGKLYSAGHPYPLKVFLLPHRKSTINKSQATITPRTKK
jgi:hypothetical protein